MIRPTEYDGVFTVTVGGAEIDFATVASSREALIKTVYEITKREELEFGDIIWLSEYR